MIVVDCSAIVDALTAPPGTDALRSELAADDLHAPALLDFEVVSALRGLVMRGEVSQARAQDALVDYDDLPIERWPSDSALRKRSFALRDSISAYDAAYVALAEALQCPLVTRDERLRRAHGHHAEIRVL